MSMVTCLDWSKTTKQFSVNSVSVSGEQASQQVNTWPLAFLSQIFNFLNFLIFDFLLFKIFFSNFQIFRFSNFAKQRWRTLNLNRVLPLIYIFVNHDNHTKRSSKLCINVLFNNYFVVLLLYFYVKKIRLQRIKRYKVRKEMGNDEVEEVTSKKLMDAILDVK